MSPVALIRAVRQLGGELRIPGDKSISHRALIFGALAQGRTTATNLAPGADVRSTASVLRQLGVAISLDDNGAARVDGVGFAGLRAPDAPLDCGNSGTTMRLMMGVLAGRGFSARLIGDQSLSGRPMKRISGPVGEMGGRFELAAGGRPPVIVHGGRLQGRKYHSPIASAQIKSAVLLAGLQAQGRTTVSEPARSRDHTERLLAAMGAALSVDGLSVTIEPGPLSALGELRVPGDLSSAAFLVAAGLLLDGPGLRLLGVGVNPTRTGFLDAVAAMGARVESAPSPGGGPEPSADLVVHRTALRPLELRGDLLVRAIDEVPILAVLATQAVGRSVIADASELRVKESDRLALTARFLTDMGATVEERPDGLVIDGPTRLRVASVQTHHDHRIAMAASVAGLLARGGFTTIHDADCASVSYPGFYDVLGRLTDAPVTAAQAPE